MKLTAARRNAMLTSWLTTDGALDSGYIRIYSGTKPTNADTALAGNTLLAELRFAADSHGTPSGGSATAGTIVGEDAALATGTATFARLFQDDGTTVEADLTVGLTSSGEDLEFPTLSFVTGVAVDLSSLTLSIPLGS